MSLAAERMLRMPPRSTRTRQTLSEGRGAPQGSSCPEGAAVTAGFKSPEAREIQPREAAVASGDLQFS